ncbi:MAG: hypothetical protein R6V28_03605 [Nitriliruptoraceae bacterium]
MANRTRSGDSGAASWSLTPGRIAALVLAVAAMIFIFQNRADTTLTVFGVSVTAPLWLFTLALITVGILIGALLTRRGKSD